MGAGAGRGSAPGRSCCCGNGGGVPSCSFPPPKGPKRRILFPRPCLEQRRLPTAPFPRRGSRDLALTPRSPRCSRPPGALQGGIFRAVGPCWTLLCDRVALCSLLLCANSGGQAQKRRYSPGNQVLPPAVPPVPVPLGIPCSQLQESLGGAGRDCMERVLCSGSLGAEGWSGVERLRDHSSGF